MNVILRNVLLRNAKKSDLKLAIYFFGENVWRIEIIFKSNGGSR